MEELLEVVKFHLPHYKNTVKICKSSPAQVNPSDLTFATKFVVMYLFIKVNGSCPLTYQYLMVDMVATAKEKGGFIDQKMLKTAGKYGFDSCMLDLCLNLRFLMQLEIISSNLAFILHIITKLLKPKASISSLVRRKGFCQKTKNTALLLQNFTSKSNNPMKLF